LLYIRVKSFRGGIMSTQKRVRKASLIVAAVLLATGPFAVAYASSGYLSAFNTQYGTSTTVLNSCNTCHTSPPTLNPYGTDYMNSGHDFVAIEGLDSDGDTYTNIVEITARTFPGNAASHPVAVVDSTAPTVTAFTIPVTSASLTVSITSFSASDNVAVTGYMITETSTAPAASAVGWSATAPSSYTFTTVGFKTLYGWAKDAAGNVSAAVSATTTISLPDSTPPVVTGFAVPATVASLTVPITTFTASDNTGVTGYLLTVSSTAPTSAPAQGWTATAPTSYTFTAPGFKTLYAWAKDAAGNVSATLTATTTITLTDSTPPVVTGFALPATVASLTVPITTFTATDNTAVTGYLVTESSTAPTSAPAQGWTATAPTSYTFAAAGSKTLYAWAKDAAGNVSAALTATTTISLSGTSGSATSGTAAATDVPASEGQSSGGGCFIATAAFGSYVNPYVRVLRSFRDVFLLTNGAGRVFVSWYYRVSPPIADIIARDSILRVAVRTCLVPLIGFSALSLAIGLFPTLMVLCLAIATLAFAAKRIRSNYLVRHTIR
jgi:hypothetical protein